MNNISQNRGFMQIVLLAIVIIATLAYFNVDLRSLMENPMAQKTIGVLVSAWTDYILPLFKFLRESAISLVLSSTEMASSTAPVVGR